MRIVHDAKGIACLVPKEVHAALKARAAREGQSVPQLAAAIITAAMADVTTKEGGDLALEAQQLRELVDRSNDDVAALRRRLAEMQAFDDDRQREIAHWKERAEGLIPPGLPPAKRVGHRDMVDRGRDEAPASDADMLTPAFVKSCVGFRAVGNSPREIARLMQCPLAQVQRALERRP